MRKHVAFIAALGLTFAFTTGAPSASDKAIASRAAETVTLFSGSFYTGSPTPMVIDTHDCIEELPHSPGSAINHTSVTVGFYPDRHCSGIPTLVPSGEGTPFFATSIYSLRADPPLPDFDRAGDSAYPIF